MTRGVYFMANDAIHELALAFLNSFRAHNPTMPLCLIPYRDDSLTIEELAARYDFTVWQDVEALHRCDEISRAFSPEDAVCGAYRKLAAWTGPFDEFVYIDCDTVVLHPVDFVFDFLDEYGFVAGTSNLAHTRKWVWHESIYQTGALTREQIDYAANTGFIASRAGLLDPDRTAAELLPQAVALASHMELGCMEQPLLNYLMVTSGLPCTSLTALSQEPVHRDLPIEKWGGMDIGTVEGGRVVLPLLPPVLFVHWAGEFQRVRREGGQIMHYDLWRHYRDLDRDPALSPQAP